MSLPKINGEVARLWAEPELRWTPSGKAVVTVPLVFTKRKRTDAGEWEDAGTMFVRAQAWEQFAENISESLAKGDEVVVTGELSVRDYERQDGSKGQSLELTLYAIGPNLKRHMAKTLRIDRQDAPASANSPDPWGSAPPSNSNGFSDEPPF
ncbi:single-stranded DNA-binding protein [Saccharopolyspora sp. K220]|uniref:single-stranded DNA-binding protein n=1 Tax=Saccharopolyspora soli TaxID=2926618 RepID=UPI001F59A07C|nr:single-stranded DNA-binding protein [Saccharopolyspora soli]MCI2421489.1 single-stranded DNA-binding protein [Saccharopolyspora soli]